MPALLCFKKKKNNKKTTTWEMPSLRLRAYFFLALAAENIQEFPIWRERKCRTSGTF